MSTIINNPPSIEAHDNGEGSAVTVMLIALGFVVVGILFVWYVLPTMQDTAAQPKTSDVNIELATPSTPAPSVTPTP